jgi:hypothetical protein
MLDFYRFQKNPLFEEPYIKPGGIREIMPTNRLPIAATSAARAAQFVKVG